MFHGDEVAIKKVKELLTRFKVQSIVETGTYYGDTTLGFSKLFSGHIFTIELNRECFVEASKTLHSCTNVSCLLGSSPKVMDELLPKLKQPVFFYLDAHWNEYWPILDELKIIAKHRIRSIIMIHDFFVPNSGLVFDSYGGQQLNLEFVKQGLDEIFGRKFDLEYNEPPAFRGILYAYPIQFSFF